MGDLRVKRLLRVSALVVVMLFAVACSSNKQAEALKPAELVDFEPSVKLKKLWSRSVGAGQDKRYTRFVPAHDGDYIYAADTKGKVFAFNAENGKKVWSTHTQEAISGAVSAGYGLVLAGTYNGEVLALGAENGELLWRAQTSSEILAAPQTNGDVVVAQTIDGRVFAFDAKTGAERWKYDHLTPVLTLRTTAAPLVTDKRVIAAFDSGQVVSLAAKDGALRWDARVSQPKGRTELERIVDIEGQPLLVGTTVYSASYQGNIVAMARSKGRVLWSEEISTFNALASDGSKIFATTTDAKVLALDADSGATIWQNEQLLRRSLGAPAVLGDYLAMIDKKNLLHVLRTEDGSMSYRTSLPGNGFRSAPLSANDKLYFLSNSGKLSAYALVQ